ncbi:MAG: hypothetical protein JW849_08885 [Phycisphaerae bacterium]|nr:hypothetical protein [Phycisphaerae bacterium]
MKWFYVISVILVVALTACPFVLLKEEDLSRFKGKVVTYSTIPAKIRYIDPAAVQSVYAIGLLENIFETLYTYHYLERPSKVIPLLADGMPEFSEDNLTCTIKIRKGIYYQENACFPKNADGRRTREITAEDFVLAMKRTADFHVNPIIGDIEEKIAGLKEFRDATKHYPEGDFSRYDKEQIAGFRATDPYTLQIRLLEPYPQLLYDFTDIRGTVPTPSEAIAYYLATQPGENGTREEIPLKERHAIFTRKEQLVGTGPYILSEWIRGEKVILVRNPNYRKVLYPSVGTPEDRAEGLLKDAGKQIPFIDVAYRRIVTELNPAWMLFLTKQQDANANIPSDAYSMVITPSKELTDQWRKEGIRLVKFSDPVVYFIMFNMRDSVLGASPSLRQALSLSFNREDYIKVIWNERAIPAENLLPSSIAGHNQAGPGPYYHFDLTAAKEKIAQAKKELIAAKVIKPGEDIPPLMLDIGGTDELARRIAEFIQNQFRQIGIRLNIETNDFPTLQKKVDNKVFQMFFMGGGAPNPDATPFLMGFYGPNIKRGINDAGYYNPEFDKLYRQASVMMDEEKRVELYGRMTKIISEDCPILMMTEPIRFILLHSWVYNYKPHPLMYGTTKFWRIDAAARRKAGGL